MYFHVSTLNPTTPSSTSIKYLGNLKEIPEKITSVVAIESIDSIKLKTQSDILNQYDEYSNTMLIKDTYDNIAYYLEQNMPLNLSTNVYKFVLLIIALLVFLLLIYTVFLVLKSFIHLLKKFLYTEGSEDQK